MNCCDITPAQLNRKVDLYRLVKTPTATGGFNESWVKVASLWAKIKNTSGTELVRADQLGATAYSDFTIRYRSNINEMMKLVYRGTDYQIRHINNIEEADKWLVVKAERGVSQ
jgi:SPP1 family predicted phage head-tail adaptor